MNKRLLFNSVILAVSVTASLMVAEFALRAIDYPPANFSPWIRDAHTAYRYAPDLVTRMTRPPEYDVSFSTNSLGLRDDEVGPKRGPRILLLGDSFASGYGVEREENIASRLEAELGVDVVNAGVGGYELIHHVHYFDARGRDLDADIVVLLLYLGNDLSRNSEWREAADGGLESVSRSYPTRAGAEFKLLRLYRQMAYRSRLDRAAQQEWVPYDDYLALCERRLGQPALDAYAQSREFLGRLRHSVESTGAHFMVAMFSYRTTVEPLAREALEMRFTDHEARYDLDRPAREMRKYFEAEGIEYVDLVPMLRERHRRDRQPLYFAIDGHFNAAGNAAVAELLQPTLQSHLARLSPDI